MHVEQPRQPEVGRERDRVASPASVGVALEPAADGLLLLALGLAVGERVALVVGLLALGQPDLDLGAAVLEVERQRDQGVALVADLALDLGDLGLVEQQLAAAARRVVGPGALGVLRDVDAVQPDLVGVDLGEPVDERGATLRAGTSPRCPSSTSPASHVSSTW